jgi:hypothetical protein
MFFGGIVSAVSASQASLMTDSDLDAAYSAYYAQGDVATCSVLGVEIINRKSSVGGFVDSLMTSVTGAALSNFPLYDAIAANPSNANISTFNSPSAATTSVSQAAANMPAVIGNAAGTAFTTLEWVVGGALVVALLIAAKK